MSDEKININTATINQIASISGISLKQAEEIFYFFWWWGPRTSFKYMDGYAKGVGKATIKKLMEHTYFGPGPDTTDINKVSGYWLSRIKGFNNDLAYEIIKRRPFRSWDDLAKVPGIGPAKLKAIKEMATISINPQQEIKNEGDSIPEEKESAQSKNTVEKSTATNQDQPGKTGTLKPKDNKPVSDSSKLKAQRSSDLFIPIKPYGTRRTYLNNLKHPEILFGHGSGRPELEGFTFESFLISPDGKLGAAVACQGHKKAKLMIVDLEDTSKKPELFSPIQFPNSFQDYEQILDLLCWHPDCQHVLIGFNLGQSGGAEGSDPTVLFNIKTGTEYLVSFGSGHNAALSYIATLRRWGRYSLLPEDILHIESEMGSSFYQLHRVPLPTWDELSSGQYSRPRHNFIGGFWTSAVESLNQAGVPNTSFMDLRSLGWDETGSRHLYYVHKPKMPGTPRKINIWKLGIETIKGGNTIPRVHAQGSTFPYHYQHVSATPAQLIETVEPNSIVRFGLDGSYAKLKLHNFPEEIRAIILSKDGKKILIKGPGMTYQKEYREWYKKQQPANTRPWNPDDPIANPGENSRIVSGGRGESYEPPPPIDTKDPRIFWVDASLVEQRIPTLDYSEHIWEIERLTAGHENHIWYAMGKYRAAGQDFGTGFIKNNSISLFEINMEKLSVRHLEDFRLNINDDNGEVTPF